MSKQTWKSMNFLNIKAIVCLSFILISSTLLGFPNEQNAPLSNSSLEQTIGGYVILGKTQNFAEGTKVFLQKQRGKKTIRLDTAVINKYGTFEMTGTVDEKDFAKLVIQNLSFAIILGNHNVNINIDKEKSKEFTFGGCYEMDAFQSLKSNLLSSKKIEKAQIQEYVDTIQFPLLAYVAMTKVKFNYAPEIYKLVLERMEKELPGQYLTTNLANYVKQQEQRMKAIENTKIGAIAQDIVMKNPEGEEIKLSDLRGKIVLLDFWASWCGPCRKEHPNLVKAYNKYHKKGLEIFSVSLDGNINQWKKAIEKDGLVWENQASDLMKWKSPVNQEFNVRSIPANFILDKDGKILAKNLRGAMLDKKLDELFD